MLGVMPAQGFRSVGRWKFSRPALGQVQERRPIVVVVISTRRSCRPLVLNENAVPDPHHYVQSLYPWFCSIGSSSPWNLQVAYISAGSGECSKLVFRDCPLSLSIAEARPTLLLQAVYLWVVMERRRIALSPKHTPSMFVFGAWFGRLSRRDQNSGGLSDLLR